MEHCSEAGEAVEPTVGLPSPTRTLLQVGDPAGVRAGQDGRPVICNPSPALCQAGFRKGRGTRDQIANIRWIMEEAREFQKNTYFCFIETEEEAGLP